MTRGGFTLIEMLLATVLSAVLLGGVMLVASAMSREAAHAASVTPNPSRAITHLLEWDFTSAASFALARDGQSLTLIGNGAIDRQSFAPDNRQARVVYRIDPSTRALTREQRYLDDEVRPQPWVEIVATGATRIGVSLPPDAGVSDDAGNTPIPNHLTVTIERDGGNVLAEVQTR